MSGDQKKTLQTIITIVSFVIAISGFTFGATTELTTKELFNRQTKLELREDSMETDVNNLKLQISAINAKQDLVLQKMEQIFGMFVTHIEKAK